MASCVLPISGSYTLRLAWHQIRHALGHETIVPPRWLLSPAAEVRRSLWPNAMDTLPPLSNREQYSILGQQCMDVEMDICPSPPVYTQYTAPTSCQAPKMPYVAPTAQLQLVGPAQPQNTIQAPFPFIAPTQHNVLSALPTANRTNKKQRCL